MSWYHPIYGRRLGTDATLSSIQRSLRAGTKPFRGPGSYELLREPGVGCRRLHPHRILSARPGPERGHPDDRQHQRRGCQDQRRQDHHDDRADDRHEDDQGGESNAGRKPISSPTRSNSSTHLPRYRFISPLSVDVWARRARAGRASVTSARRENPVSVGIASPRHPALHQRPQRRLERIGLRTGTPSPLTTCSSITKTWPRSASPTSNRTSSTTCSTTARRPRHRCLAHRPTGRSP